MKTFSHSQSGYSGWKSPRMIFKIPEKEGGAPPEIKVPRMEIVVTAKEAKEIHERFERKMKDYENKRKTLDLPNLYNWISNSVNFQL